MSMLTNLRARDTRKRGYHPDLEETPGNVATRVLGERHATF